MSANCEKNVFACHVCFDDYNESDRKPLLLPCTHYFCKQCLLQMQIFGKKQCPTCELSWAGTTVVKLIVCSHLVHKEGSTSTATAPGCSAAGTCKHPDYAVEFWCQDCKVILCKTCLIEHIHCNWSFESEAREDVIKEIKKEITSAKLQVTNRMTKAISETEEKVDNIRAAMEILRLQESKFEKYNDSLSDILDTTLDGLNNLENI